MKFAMVVAFAFLSTPCAAQSTKERQLSQADEQRIERALFKSRSSDVITEQQLQLSITFLHDCQCDAIDGSLTASDQANWTTKISSLKGFDDAKVERAFTYLGWRIAYVTFPNAEPAYLIYSSDPAKSQPVANYGGGAALYDAPDIERWLVTEALGIPGPLAHCFAWHMTFSP